MDFSEFKKRVYSYLGINGEADAETDGKIFECFSELESASQFNYVYKTFSSPPQFLLKEPYLSYLEGSEGVILCITTLGAETDKRLNYLSRFEPSKAVIFDACASAYLEILADEYEKTIGKNLSYRFCPGYGGSDISDIKYIFENVKSEKAGVSLTETFYMLPAKSMAGIIAVNGNKEKTCNNCVLEGRCKFAKDGVTCYGSEKK